eukprot:NODE_1726_length_1237_cov_60.456757_g1711_i0.p1 GENE.NODE_1726_length_1237_cov_60.456757_g1711_i0~~NODE_1726_length_1237_cov_60.456757_g1711_i0.p1  ORF type:complete len:367 (+),score=102.63 NODE_1726_length_1237_cov_60.456757_g1711_i0:94-1194(+)
MLSMENEDEVREEAARLIQTKWRERKRATEQQNIGTEDSAQQEKDKRERLLKNYREQYAAREKMLSENFALQRKLSQHFHEKRGQEADKAGAGDTQNATDQETRYMTWLQRLNQERSESKGAKDGHEDSLKEYKAKLHHYMLRAQECETKFQDFKRDKCGKAEFTRTGKAIPAKKLEAFEQEETEKNQEVHAVRIKYIKMRNRMKKLAHSLKEKEKLTDGLHLIDFEQLKIENTTLNEKIEERNEDLLKLKKKATTTIHILTHVKEKLQFIQGENQGLKKQLQRLEEELAGHRDKLTTVKRDRDMLVNDNVKMREKMPMVGAEDLLVDYEHRKKDIERLRQDVVSLKNTHHELFVWIAQKTPVASA